MNAPLPNPLERESLDQAAQLRLKRMRDAMALRDRLRIMLANLERVGATGRTIEDTRDQLAALKWLLREIGGIEG